MAVSPRPGEFVGRLEQAMQGVVDYSQFGEQLVLLEHFDNEEDRTGSFLEVGAYNGTDSTATRSSTKTPST